VPCIPKSAHQALSVEIRPDNGSKTVTLLSRLHEFFMHDRPIIWVGGGGFFKAG